MKTLIRTKIYYPILIFLVIFLYLLRFSPPIIYLQAFNLITGFFILPIGLFAINVLFLVEIVLCLIHKTNRISKLAIIGFSYGIFFIFSFYYSLNRLTDCIYFESVSPTSRIIREFLLSPYADFLRNDKGVYKDDIQSDRSILRTIDLQLESFVKNIQVGVSKESDVLSLLNTIPEDRWSFRIPIDVNHFDKSYEFDRLLYFPAKWLERKPNPAGITQESFQLYVFLKNGIVVFYAIDHDVETGDGNWKDGSMQRNYEFLPKEILEMGIFRLKEKYCQQRNESNNFTLGCK